MVASGFQQSFILVIQIHDVLELISGVAAAIAARVGKIQYLIPNTILFVRHLTCFNLIYLLCQFV